VIVYRDLKRFTYRQLHERIGRLASSLARLGVGAGDTVGVLDWDSNRFLEAYFAVPMMGAVLQTVNVRLPPEQIAYTINHADRYDPALLLKLIKTEGVTFTHGVPTILQMLLGAAVAANTDLAGLKMVIGGSELPKALARQALALGVDVYAGYGMSESAPLLCLAQVKSADLIGDPEKAVDSRRQPGAPPRSLSS
jgi:acyl-CoA synthetase (AMP-forming)/AMP-acid ligase II